ncbi:MAG: DUF4249 domain-containing protein [Gillisia sp.]
MGSKNTPYLYLLLCFLFLQGCVEPIEFENEGFENALVVEATITNEEKLQEVLLSRSFPLDFTGAFPEQGARVSILDNTGNQFFFNETTPGRYVSLNTFNAVEGRLYTLEITTSDGKNYTSDASGFKGTTSIESVYGVLTQNQEGVQGVDIRVNSTGSQENTGYYRYEYIETYKILSRYFRYREAVLITNNNNSPEVVVVEKTIQDNTCYNSAESNEILLSNSTSMNQDRVVGSFLRFIRQDNPIFANRYSILVKQYGISREAFSYYQSLKELSESESLFSQIQPGLLAGNMVSLDNPSEYVLGFFSVASVTERRVYFNYVDFYDPFEQPKPHFTDSCPLEYPTQLLEIQFFAQSEQYRLYSYDPPSGEFIFVSAPCVDCTLLGTNVVPEFWED